MGSSKRRFYHVTTNAERRARAERNGEGNPTLGRKASKAQKWLRTTLIKKHSGKCVLCSESVVLKPSDHSRAATIDHIIPVSRGGADVIANMQLACLECNRKKGDMTMEEYLSTAQE